MLSLGFLITYKAKNISLLPNYRSSEQLYSYPCHDYSNTSVRSVEKSIQIHYYCDAILILVKIVKLLYTADSKLL